MNTDRPELLQLAAEWGFVENDELQALHAQIVAAITAGEPTKPLWQRYLAASDHLTDFDGPGVTTDKARSAREIVRGLIWLEAGETVRGLTCLIIAAVAAIDNYWEPEEELIQAEISRHGTQAELHQAWGLYYEEAQDTVAAEDQYEKAIKIYEDAENDNAVVGARRALINRHLAECQLGLIRLGMGDIPWLQQQVVAYLESTPRDAEGTPEAVRIQALLDETAAEPWWEAAIARQQA